MSHRFINTFADGEILDGTYLLGDKQLRANRHAETYLLVELRDRTGAISARMWNVGEAQAAKYNPGDFVHVKGKIQLYQGALQIILSQVHYVPPDGLDPAEFVRQTDRNVTDLTARLKALLLSIQNPPLKLLMECFLIDDALMLAYANAPAGTKAHHAYRGGLIEHVVTMMDVADRISGLYPGVDRDLLLAGVFLHDIGKVRELSPDNLTTYTDEGQLIGHIAIGLDLLGEKIAAAARLSEEPFPPELALRLRHMILSHNGTYEFGSPRLPMTPEAIALHYIDNLDAKIHEFCRDIADDPNPQGSFTPYNARLDRKLFKGLRGETA